MRVDNSNTELYGSGVYADTTYFRFIYDRDNTAYYLDPNSSSNTNVFTANEFYTNNWFRVNGGGGLYWQAYGGGWYMQDTTWLRAYNSKAILATGGIAGYGNSVFGTPYGSSPRMYANYDNATGGGIMVADDGGFFDFNDAWIEFRGSTGLAVRSDSSTWDLTARMYTSGGSLYDKMVATDTNAWGLLGGSSNAWWQVYAYSYNTVSDERQKKDITDLTEGEMRDMLDQLDQVRSIRYRYNVETDTFDESKPHKYRAIPHVGVIAQSMPKEVVVDDGGAFIGVNLQDEIGYTIAALRGLRAESRERDDKLEARIEALEAAMGIHPPDDQVTPRAPKTAKPR